MWATRCTRWVAGSRPSSPAKAWSCTSPGRGGPSSRPGARTPSPVGWRLCCPPAATRRASASRSGGSRWATDRIEGGRTVSVQEQNKALIRLFYEEIDKGTLDAMDELVAEDYLNHDPPPFPGLS